ncbi:MAG: radical SAM protein [Candidatus Magasanikbacteria bacterium]
MKIKIAWYGKHFGEEPPLCGDKNPASSAGKHGAGGIFFSGCNLRCVFCQNIQISQQGMGKEYSVDELAKIMLDLQNNGAVNIDLVTPTIWHKQIKTAIVKAKEMGLVIPIVWNSNGFETKEILRQMNGLVDIYVPDFKYGDDILAEKYSGVKNYVATAEGALKEMLWQVGKFKTDKNGLGERGVVVRHLVLPNNVENSFKVLEKLEEIDNNIHISLMRQYYPLHDAKKYPELMREVSDEEWNLVYERMLDLGFANGWAQDKDSTAIMIPDFTKEKPFE